MATSQSGWMLWAEKKLKKAEEGFIEIRLLQLDHYSGFNNLW